MNIKEGLGRVVHHLREAQHLTIDGLAAKAGIPAEQLDRIERGQDNPKVGATLLPLAGALGVTLSELLLAAEAEETQKE